jgi:hypothetical protein
MRKVGAIGAVVVVACAALLSTNAEAQMPTADRLLTPAVVEAFISSYPVVKQTTDSLSQQYGIDAGDEDPSAWQAWAGVAAAQGALNAACQGYGFSDFSDWVQVFVSVATAYAFAKEGPGTNAEMTNSIAEIQNNPSLSDAQKQMLIQQMQAVMGMMNMIMPPQQNLDAVAPYADQLAALFDDA